MNPKVKWAELYCGHTVFRQRRPKVGATVQFMKPLGVVESVKAASDIFSPLSGKVIAVNTDLVKTPEAINKDCYGAGWIVKIEPSKQDELNSLFDAKGYTELISKA